MPEMSIEDGIILKLTDRVQELENKVAFLEEQLGAAFVGQPTVPTFEQIEQYLDAKDDALYRKVLENPRGHIQSFSVERDSEGNPMLRDVEYE